VIALLLALWLYIPVHAVVGSALADPAPTEQVQR